jgi:hypothetical protein
VKKLLIVTDLKAGHENQSKAFARALGCEAEVREVRFGSRFKKALSYLYDRLGIFSESLFQGSRCFYFNTCSGGFLTPLAAKRVTLSESSASFFAASLVATSAAQSNLALAR